MALIICPECGQKVSDKAKACPGCGYPISELSAGANNNSQDDTNKEVTVSEKVFPDFPVVMKIGKRLGNWHLGAVLEGAYFHSENVVTSIPNGDVNICLHTNGISILKDAACYCICDKQITKMSFVSREKIIEESKSVIGRASAGNFLLGPLGAMIGSASGIGNKPVLKGKYYLVINYWDVYSKLLQTILICTKESPIYFIDKYNAEKSKFTIPEGKDCVANVFNDDKTLNKDKIKEAVKYVPATDLSMSIMNLMDVGDSIDSLTYVSLEVYNALNDENLHIEDIPTSSGCLGTLLLLITTTITSVVTICSLV